MHTDILHKAFAATKKMEARLYSLACMPLADDIIILEPAPRATFRSTLSQPSQMGNFKHQSIRTTERDRDRDTDKDRDLRDREGHERLRNVCLDLNLPSTTLTLLQLSDKFDRDRLALPATSSLRNRERDSAPHLTPAGTSRVGSTASLSTSNSRRTDAREVTKRKPGESSDDWRKGTFLMHTTLISCVDQAVI